MTNPLILIAFIKHTNEMVGCLLSRWSLVQIQPTSPFLLPFIWGYRCPLFNPFSFNLIQFHKIVGAKLGQFNPVSLRNFDHKTNLQLKTSSGDDNGFHRNQRARL